MIDIFRNNKNDMSKYKGSRVCSLLKLNTQDKINKLESRPFNITNETINNVLDISDFQRLRRLLGKYLSECGEAAIYAFPHQNEKMVGVLFNLSYKMIGKREIEVSGQNGANYFHNGVPCPINVRLFFKNNIPTISRFIMLTDENEDSYEVEIAEDVQFPQMNTLPVEVFFNNEEKLGDVQYAGVLGDLDRLEYLDGELRAEFELSRNMLTFNTNFTDNDPKSETLELKNGRGYMKETSFNSKLREGTSIISANGSVILHQQMVDTLENDIRSKLFLKLLPSQEQGTNKHNLEMVTKEELHIEYLLSMKAMREKHWQAFFDKLAKLLNVDTPTINLEISEIVQAKLDILEATVAAEKAKATGKLMTNQANDIAEEV